MKACVLGFPSALLAKFRLKDVNIEFFLSGFSVCLLHCPIHGPQALVIMTPPIDLKSEMIPSLSAVYRTCSEPGFTINSALTVSPFAAACRATEAALLIS